MKKIIILLALFLGLNNFVSTAIEVPPIKGSVEGIIVATTDSNPIEYATVALYSTNTDSLITGAITNKSGEFILKDIPLGDYDLVASFMGYANKRIRSIQLSNDKHAINLSSIKLDNQSTTISEVEIVGLRKSIDYKIDKKVISVSNQLTSASLSAIEVLENIPSIDVDIEGNVSLRGSTGFTVLIDGRPSILDPSDALRQIPASIIENIEVITNPSAKYQPDGTAGIINIITKKNKTEGIQGLINANFGSYNQHGGDFLLSKRHKKVNIYFGADYRHKENPGTQDSERQTTNNSITTNTITHGESERIYSGYGFRAGVDWDLNDNNLFSLGARTGNRDRKNNQTSDYTQYLSTSSDIDSYTNKEWQFRGGDFYHITSNYKHIFPSKKGHELLTQFTYSKSISDEYSKNELYDLTATIEEGKYNTEKGPSEREELKIDYTLPINENSTFETGFQGRWRTSGDDTKQFVFENNEYIIQPLYTNETDYQRDIYAMYSTYNTTLNKFGVQLGMRGEYTDRKVQSLVADMSKSINRWDLFPTLHFSYQLSENDQFMTSYTRRIERPRGYYLEPFLTWMDAYNVRQGNPDIEPEYIDSYEFGYLKNIGESRLSVEAYHKTTHNKIERVISIFSDDIILHSVKNIGKDYSLGFECMYSAPIKKWWEIDIMGNWYHYKVEGQLLNQDFSNETNNWSSSINNTIRFTSKTQLQISGKYRSATATAQGTREGNYRLNAAFRADFMKRSLSCVIQASDLLQSSNYEGTSRSENLYTHYKFKRSAPLFSITLSYRLNNYKPQKKNSQGGGDTEGGEQNGENGFE